MNVQSKYIMQINKIELSLGSFYINSFSLNAYKSIYDTYIKKTNFKIFVFQSVFSG